MPSPGEKDVSHPTSVFQSDFFPVTSEKNSKEAQAVHYSQFVSSLTFSQMEQVKLPCSQSSELVSSGFQMLTYYICLNIK